MPSTFRRGCHGNEIKVTIISSHIVSFFFMKSKAYQMENLVNKSGKEISEEARN